MKKLSQKEKGEVVTKGYLADYIESKDFVTKDWAQEMFEKFEENIVRHTNALKEFHHHENQLIIEALISRIERVERHVGLASI